MERINLNNPAGLNAVQKETTVEKLNSLLASYQTFYQNLRGLHWNIVGRSFFSLHEKFEELYDEAAADIDEIAERILTLGGRPLHSFAEYLEHSSLQAVTDVSAPEAAVQVVLANSQYLLENFREIVGIASENGDEGTVALMSDFIRKTEKRIWMYAAWSK